jgi:hypothetical protein
MPQLSGNEPILGLNMKSKLLVHNDWTTKTLH